MKYDDENRKFKIGDTVKVRDDLEVGMRYYTGEDKSDIFTSQMRNNRGKEGRVIELTHVGYKLDIDPIHTYTEEMLEEPRDILAESDYTFNVDVEKVLMESEKLYYKKKMDEALSNRLFESDPKAFKELNEQYKKYFK